MAPKVFLSDELCLKASKKLAELLEAGDKQGVGIQERAAKTILTACQNQHRYNLAPKTPQDFQRSLEAGTESARTLETMTPEQLLELQKTMLGDLPPGKPA